MKKLKPFYILIALLLATSVGNNAHAQLKLLKKLQRKRQEKAAKKRAKKGAKQNLARLEQAEKNALPMIWTSNKIDVYNKDAAPKSQKNFTLGDPIVGTIFFERREAAKNMKVRIQVFVDGIPLFFSGNNQYRYFVPKKDLFEKQVVYPQITTNNDPRYLQFELIPDMKNYAYNKNPFRLHMLKEFSKLSTGKHKITAVLGGDRSGLSKKRITSFTLDCTKEGLARLKKMKDKLEAEWNENSKIKSAYDIIWLNKALTRNDRKNAPKAQKVFKAGEPIIANIFLDKNVRALQQVEGSEKAYTYLTYDIYVNGEKFWNGYQLHVKSITTSEQDRDFLKFELVPNMNKFIPYKDNLSRQIMTRELATLDPGKHEVIIKLNFRAKGAPLVYGKFIFEATSEGAKKLSAMSKKIEKSDVSMVSLPAKGRLHSATLAAQALDAIQLYGKKSHWDEKFNKVVITSDGWVIIRHRKTGIIQGRIVEGAATAKHSSGKCTYQYFDFYQPYVGGKFSNGLSRYATGAQYEIGCNK
ncbi:hypothetical protein BKI52_14385 [marine bacterium AO1-C]|nr:hypothetical protein BKI52_14385 [marine bacterium AO1-C]